MKIGAELQRKLGVACTVPVGFAVVLLNGLWSFFFFFLSVTHHQEALEGMKVLKEWVQD